MPVPSLVLGRMSRLMADQESRAMAIPVTAEEDSVLRVELSRGVRAATMGRAGWFLLCFFWVCLVEQSNHEQNKQ